MGERLLFGGGAGRCDQLDGDAVRLQRSRQRDHRRQDPRGAVDHRRLGPAVRPQPVERAGAAGAGGGGRGEPALRRCPPGQRTGCGAAGRRRVRANAGGRADVPVQQSGRPSGVDAGCRRVLRAASLRKRQQPLVVDRGRRRGGIRIPGQDAAGVAGAARIRRCLSARRRPPAAATGGRRAGRRRGHAGVRRVVPAARRIVAVRRRVRISAARSTTALSNWRWATTASGG